LRSATPRPFAIVLVHAGNGDSCGWGAAISSTRKRPCGKTVVVEWWLGAQALNRGLRGPPGLEMVLLQPADRAISRQIPPGGCHRSGVASFRVQAGCGRRASADHRPSLSQKLQLGMLDRPKRRSQGSKTGCPHSAAPVDGASNARFRSAHRRPRPAHLTPVGRRTPGSSRHCQRHRNSGTTSPLLQGAGDAVRPRRLNSNATRGGGDRRQQTPLPRTEQRQGRSRLFVAPFASAKKLVTGPLGSAQLRRPN